MSAVTSRRAVVLTAAVTATLLLSGCRGADRVAAGAPSGTPVVTGSGAQDPLAGLEATVGAVERDLDADADAAGG
jgi:hypothetical protein